MPIANIQDTTGVERQLQEILSTADVDRRLQIIRELFVGILDYDSADQLVSLESSGNAQLPKDAHVAARRDGVSVAYIPLDNADTNRVNGIAASAAAKALGNVLADDLLLVFTNRDRDQLHIISPDLSGSPPQAAAAGCLQGPTATNRSRADCQDVGQLRQQGQDPPGSHRRGI